MCVIRSTKEKSIVFIHKLYVYIWPVWIVNFDFEVLNIIRFNISKHVMCSQLFNCNELNIVKKMVSQRIK